MNSDVTLLARKILIKDIHLLLQVSSQFAEGECLDIMLAIVISTLA